MDTKSNADTYSQPNAVPLLLYSEMYRHNLFNTPTSNDSF